MNIIQTFAQLQQVKVKESQRFTCVERANAEYVVQPSGYVALAGDVTFSNGLIGKLVINDKPHIDLFGGKTVQGRTAADTSFDNATAFADMRAWCVSNNYGGIVELGRGYYRTTQPLDYNFVTMIKGCGKNESYIHADHLLGPAIRFREANSGIIDCGVTASTTRRAKAYVYGDTNFGILYESDDVAEASSQRLLYANCERFYLFGHPDGLMHIVGGAFTGSIKNFELQASKGHALSFDRGEATGRVNLISIIISGVCNIINGRISDCEGHAIATGSPTSNFSTPCLRVVFDNIEGGNNATNAAILYYPATNYIRGANMVYQNSGLDVDDLNASVFVAGRNIHLTNNRMLGNYSKGYVIGSYDELPTNGVYISGMAVINPLVPIDPLIEVTQPAGETIEPKNIFIWQGEDANIVSLIKTDATMGSGNYNRVPLLFVNGSRPDVIKTVDQSVTNSTATVNDDELKIWLTANESISYEFQVEYQGPDAGDIRLLPNPPAGATSRYSSSPSGFKLGSGDTATLQSVESGAVLTYGATSLVSRIATISGFVENGATEGFLTLNWAQLTANASPTTVLAGLSKLSVKERKKL